MLTVAGDETGGAAIDGRSMLDEIAREGARRMLVAALETEVAAYLHRPRYRARCRRPCLGRSQWPGPHAEGHAGRGHNRRQCAAYQRPAGRHRRPALQVHEPHPTAVHAAFAEGCRGAARALPARTLDGRLPRGPRRAPREGRRWPLGNEHRAANQRVGDRVPHLPEAEPGRPRLRVRLGRWRALQRPSRRRPALHAS